MELFGLKGFCNPCSAKKIQKIYRLVVTKNGVSVCGSVPMEKEPVRGTPTKAKCDQCHVQSGQEHSLMLCGRELGKNMGEFRPNLFGG